MCFHSHSLSFNSRQTINVLLPCRMLFLRPIVACPNRFSNEQAHQLHNLNMMITLSNYNSPHIHTHIYVYISRRGKNIHLNVVCNVQSEPMVYTSGEHNHVSFLDPYADPTVILVPYIKIPTSLQAVTNLFIRMNVLCKEALQLLLIVLHFFWAQVQQIL